MPDGRQGRLLPQAAARRPRRAARRRSSASTCLRARRCSTSPTTSSTARSCTRPTCACSTRTTPTSSSRPTRAPRRSRTPPTRVAEEYGFWLGDAFASGGSSGYDHKELGITARGAWESVKRHLRELEVDPRHGPVHGRRDRRHVRRRVRQRDAALGPHPPRRRLRPPPHLHRPRSRTRTSASPSASGCSTSPARRGTTTTGRRSPRAAASGRAAAKRIPLSPRRARALGIEDERARAHRRDPRDPARARSTCSGTAASAPS